MRSPHWFADRARVLVLLIGLIAGPIGTARAQQAPPPKIQALIEKSKSGGKLTEAEQSQLIDWYSAQAKAQMRGQLDAMRPKPSPRNPAADSARFANAGNSGDDDGRRRRIGLTDLAVDSRGCPSMPGSSALRLGAGVMTESRTRALLDSISRDMLILEGNESAPVLRRVVSERSDAKTAAGMAGALWLSGADYAAAYMYAESAKRSLTAQTLTNLGAALNSIGDPRRAALLLRVADAITPRFPPILTNLGVAYAKLGDLQAADASLRAATRIWPTFAEAQTSFARVLRCEGKLLEAVAAAQLGVGGSPTARRQRITQVIESEADDSKEGKGAPSNASSDAASSDEDHFPDRPPQPQKVINVGGKKSTDVTLTFIPLGGNLAEYSGRVEKAIRAAKRVSDDAGVALDQAKSLESAALGVLYPRPTRTANGMSIRSSDANAWIGLEHRGRKAEKQASRADSVFTEDARHAIARFEQIAGMLDNSDMKHIKEVNCSKAIASANEAYGSAHSAYVAYHAGVQRAMQDYARDAAAWIAEMNEPAVVNAAGARVAARIASWDAQVSIQSGFLAHAVLWQSFCTKPRDSDLETRAAKAMEKPEPEDCEPFFDRGIGVLNIVLTCRTFEISGGEGLIGKVKYDVVSKSGTVFLGAGFSTPKTFSATEGSLAEKINQRIEASAPPPWVEGHAGVTLGFDGNGLTDGGFSFGIKGGAGGKDIDLTTQMTIVNGMTHSDGFSSAFGPSQ